MTNLYNTLLTLSRNILFYNQIKLKDNFETRIYLMFIHFSIVMIVFKKKNNKFDQKSYDILFHNIENNLRELGFGDVSVNKKMKDFNKILYDILLKIDLDQKQIDSFKINKKLISKYFTELNDPKSKEFAVFESYFIKFFNYCFELKLDNMVREAIKFKY
ncbi:ubiquinol-cytochrome C chaperone family protein [Candidatus Pelagibacter bacterium]|nr:ubiquinol-cytochrome C chaperone family protein [Candidatus Pelagibacter bacterium]